MLTDVKDDNVATYHTVLSIDKERHCEIRLSSTSKQREIKWCTRGNKEKKKELRFTGLQVYLKFQFMVLI